MSERDYLDLAEIRKLLESREADCWLRLEDAVSELVAVHGVAETDIFRRIAALLEDERAAAAGNPS